MKTFLISLLVFASHAFSQESMEIQCHVLAEFSESIEFDDTSYRLITGTEKTNKGEIMLSTKEPYELSESINYNKLRREYEKGSLFLAKGKITKRKHWDDFQPINLFLYVVTNETSIQVDKEYEKLGHLADQQIFQNDAKYILYEFSLNDSYRCRCYVDEYNAFNPDLARLHCKAYPAPKDTQNTF